MERERRISHSILIAVIFLIQSCLRIPISAIKTNDIKFIFDAGQMMTKSADPDEIKITDISLLIFDADGNIEECIWFPDAVKETTVSLIKGNRYHIRACANFGYPIYADHIDELNEVTYYLAYPDEYQEGIPMFASIDNIKSEKSAMITVPFERLMAKISLRMDRSLLSEDVNMNVISARIGNCPKSVKICGPSRITSHDQCFASGFWKGEFDTTPMNLIGPDKTSEMVSLYMLENMQGDIIPSLDSDQEKIFPPEDPRNMICSYIELELEYMSSSKYTSTRNLIYRFYLGDSRNNLDVERNCHYNITIRPEDDGLSGDGWRVDKSGILDREPISFAAYPSDYIRGDIGEQVHIWCEVSPADTPFDIGWEYLEDDKAEGIYNYEIDKDGHGVTLTLTGPGTGLIYMSAGEPVNDAALFIIEVNTP